MNSRRQASTFAVALLMAGLVIVVGLSLPICHATPIIATPITNETGAAINVIDPLVILNKTIARIDAELISLEDKLNRVRDAMAVIGELDNRTDMLEMHSDDLYEQVIRLEDKISGLQNIILFACIATSIIVISSVFFVIKKGAVR